MKKMIRKLLSVCLAVSLIAILSATTVMASLVAYGSENAGYMVGTTQLRKKTNTFDDSALDKKYKGYVNYGAKVWKESGVVTLRRDSSSINKISKYEQVDSSAVAYEVSYSDLKTGKIQRFEIKFNISYMDGRPASRNNATAAHEMGHSLGLLDLYETKNKGKLMYGITDRGTTKPTAADIKGGKYATRK